MTPISEFYTPVRMVLGDLDSSAQLYSNQSILEVVRMVVYGGQIPGYTLSADKLYVTPDLVDPNSWLLLVYKAAAVFAFPALGERYSYQHRALSESFGGNLALLQRLETELYRLENGSMFSSWQSMADWLAGTTGQNIWQTMTEMKTTVPVSTFTIP
jgi:hypothetical protein